MSKLLLILFFLLIIPCLSVSSEFERFHHYQRETILDSKFADQPQDRSITAYDVLGPENGRFQREIMGSIEVHSQQTTVYYQDVKTLNIGGFAYDRSDRESLSRALRLARDEIIEKYLGMNIITNVRPK